MLSVKIVIFLCLLVQYSNAIAPIDLASGERGSRLSRSTSTMGRMVNHRSKQHIPVEEVMKQLGLGDDGMVKIRQKRDTPYNNESLPDFFTHEFDTNNFALSVYTGILKNEVIFVLTYDIVATGLTTNLYRSDDYGETFKNINMKVGNGAAIQPVIYIGPQNHKLVWLIDANQPIIYVSTDEGLTFTARTISPITISTATITPHEMMDNWFIAKDPVNNALYVSRDLGSTACIKIADNVDADDRVQWGAYPYDDMSTVYFLSNKVFYYQQFPYQPENQKRFGDAVDFNDFLVIDRFIYLEYLANTSTTLYQLYMSADRQPFQEAKVPSRGVEGHYQYIVVNAKSNQALLISRHGNGQYNLYFSDETGVYFSESLAALAVVEVVPDQTYYIDLAVSMNFTTYVANQILPGFFLRTLISFNAGGSWHPVNVPEGTNCSGVEPCSLHFHMDISNIWRLNVYDRDAAPGYLMALGGASPYFNPNLADLFISRDGGFTWSLALEGPWLASVLDHGSLIVVAPYYRSAENGSTTLMYSCDEGMTWASIEYTNTPVHVVGLSTEPGEISTSVALYGVHPNTFSWVLSVVDFSNIFPSECGEDDYYDWTPYDEYAPTGCFLGAEITIERRKSDVCCLNTHTYTRVIDYKICECTLEDYRCDYGFKPISIDVNACTQDFDVDLNECANGERYYIRSLGYRKGSGNICEGGIEGRFMSQNLTCTAASTGQSGSSYQGAFIAVLVLLILALMVILGLGLIILVCFVVRSGSGDAAGNKNFQHEQFTDSSSAYGEEMASKEREAAGHDL